MALVARILGLSMVTAGLGALLAFVLYGQYSDWTGVALFLGCVGAIIGTIAGAAREIASRPQR